jgi:predicted O-methyltransferase YrrM
VRRHAGPQAQPVSEGEDTTSMAMRSEDAAFQELVDSIDGAPMMSPLQGRQIWDHLRTTKPDLVLDVGTYLGASAAYMAGAMKANGKGRVVTIDTGQIPEWNDIAVPACEALWHRCGVFDRIEAIRVPDSYYHWWIFEQVRAQTGPDGACEPLYDFCYLDGVKMLTVDGVCAVLIAQLLKPGGWLLFDDLRWVYAGQDEEPPVVEISSGARFVLSERERATPQIRAVFDHVVKPNPMFGAFREQLDGWWGWAQRAESDHKHLTVETRLAEEVPGRELVVALGRRVQRRIVNVGNSRRPRSTSAGSPGSAHR